MSQKNHKSIDFAPPSNVADDPVRLLSADEFTLLTASPKEDHYGHEAFNKYNEWEGEEVNSKLDGKDMVREIYGDIRVGEDIKGGMPDWVKRR